MDTPAIVPVTAPAPAVTPEQVWDWLGQVPDPEIPVISVVDLGIVRAVVFDAAAGEWVVTITPTYSGCPAMAVIAEDVQAALKAHGLARVRIDSRLSPAWTTDWMSDAGRAALKGYGIAPPVQQVIDISGLANGVGRHAIRAPQVACPHCGSNHTRLTSQFGSTPCKALYQCLDCREPFDYFKCH
ncbi:phenylacetate-CoA oxygenase subunit PaaJ [Massilia forsythiae]|uniref:Phenylacetate-CoA oxygenase subunit PaaJ n=1 Tax=Massilia forsythiae TaxID=2728020 RepID=A0A7Z2ZSH9_9BURK|nr:1,2-phenylacetyl-CoA epoxidase subunit PaaD [Massilia forsythiae]QJE00538.1 phenylacetate-CoA oxygenase subunit PaaJ [Massilia forsythiae]